MSKKVFSKNSEFRGRVFIVILFEVFRAVKAFSMAHSSENQRISEILSAITLKWLQESPLNKS